MTARALAVFGYGVLTAPDGEAGVRLFQQHADDIACVLLDLTMPRLDGEATLCAILAWRPGARVVMMTGYSEADTAERLAGMGVADFLQKPFELGRLRDVVERATSG